jgi:hypothetical protein
MADLFSAPSPLTYKDLVNQQRAQYHTLLAEGKIEPLVYPFALLPALLPVAYLLFPWYKYPRLRFLRYPIFGFIVFISIWMSRTCRSPSKGIDYGIGFVACFSVYKSAIVILFDNPQEEYVRIWRCRPITPSSEEVDNRDTRASQSSPMPNGTSQRKQKKLVNAEIGHTISRRKNIQNTNISREKTGSLDIEEHGSRTAESQIHLYLQGYPGESFKQRLDWVVGVFASLRGVGWNWCIDGLPPPPIAVQQELHERYGTPLYPGDPTIGPSGNRRYNDRQELLRSRILAVTLFYFALDGLKVWLMKDPYFWGFVDSPAPSFLPTIFHQSATLLRVYRMLISMAGIYSALSMLFSAGTLFYVGLLGPKLINVAGEPWIYPDDFGSFTMIFDKGLAGFWGGWWHQLFRFTFSSPSKWILQRWNIDRKSNAGKSIQLFIAFGMSGALHGSGSYGQLPATNPITGPFLFFFLQSFGIIGEMAVQEQLRKMRAGQQVPQILRRIGNIIWVFIWFYYTSPLLTEDFSRGGIWLFEPVPISPLRGLGFGLASEGWLCYDLPLGTWHRGSRWWLSGIAL